MFSKQKQKFSPKLTPLEVKNKTFEVLVISFCLGQVPSFRSSELLQINKEPSKSFEKSFKSYLTLGCMKSLFDASFRCSNLAHYLRIQRQINTQ